MATDPKLPPLDTVSDWVRETRDELDITLSELGEAARISSTQLNRLEHGDGNPSYQTVYRVYRELKEQQGDATVEAILDSKRERFAGLEFEYIEPDDTCAEAAARMDKYSISQLPVVDNEQAIGSVTDTTLIELNEELETISVSDIAAPPFPEVAVTTDQETVRNLLRTNQAVLLTKSPDDGAKSPGDEMGASDPDIAPVVGPYVGIVTAADFR